MKIGIYEKSLPLDLSWPLRLQATADAKFDFLEMAIDDDASRLSRLDWSKKQRSILRTAAADTGIPVYAIVLSAHRKFSFGSASPQIRQKALDIIKKAIDLAVDVGIRAVQLAGYFVFEEPHWDGARSQFLEGLERSEAWASQAGVMLGLENMDGEDVLSIPAALDLISKISSPWLQLYPDVGNISANGLDVSTELRAGAGHIIGIHLKDTRPGEFRRVLFGQGTVRFADAFRSLFQMKYHGPVTLEMWNDDSPEAIQMLIAAREWMLLRLVEGGMASGNTKGTRDSAPNEDGH
jgi:L-ribulose-5-phosphate 3-epimerase